MYDTFIRDQLKSTQIDLEDTGTYTIKVAFLTSSYNPITATDEYWDDISADEVSGTNYTAGGIAFSSPVVTLSGGETTVGLTDPSNISQSLTGFDDARRAVIYADTGTPATSKLICYSEDFGVNKGNKAGDLAVSLDTGNIFKVTQ